MKVVLSHATDLYFDHPYEPDPEERGFYWASRLTETRNIFNYMPDSVYDNMEVDLFGRPLIKDEVCANVGCVPLESGKERFIEGEVQALTLVHLLQICFISRAMVGLA